MGYWYPKITRVAELGRELGRLEQAVASQLDNVYEQLPNLSGELRRAQIHGDFPTHQIPRWLWLASQYRLHAATDPSIAKTAGAALHFLSSHLTEPSLSDADIQDLNWVLESVVCALSGTVGLADLRGCLSEEELVRIDERLSSHSESDMFEATAMRVAVDRQMRLLRDFGTVADIAGLDAKVAALFVAAEKPGPENNPARAALKYLAEENDVVSDRTGVLGLVDDIYAIEWAYAAVESQTRCLPLLQAMLHRWPFVSTSMLREDGNTLLDRYGQYVACAALYGLYEPASGVVVVRDPGAFPVVSAIAAALEAARLQVKRFGDEVELWADGDPVTISDGTETFRAVFAGQMQLDNGIRYRLRVRDRGVITVGEEVLPYVARSAQPHKRLSTGQQISIWLKNQHVDPLTYLTGAGRRRPQMQESVLLVGPRWKLDKYLPCLRLLGATPAALLGVRWIDGQQRAIDLPGSATDRPLIYACADAAVACELIADRPAHVAGWKVIIDGARLGQTLYSALSGEDRQGNNALCIFAGLADREATAAVVEQGLKQCWYLEDQDVSVPSARGPTQEATQDPLVRFLDRQSNHWMSIQTVHSDYDPFLEDVATCLEERGSSPSDDPVVQALDFSVATFLRRVISRPLRGGARQEQELQEMAAQIAAQSSLLAAFDELARRLKELFSEFVSAGAVLTDRSEPIARIVGTAEDGETVAVVCRSTPIAEKCRRQSIAHPLLSRLDWISMETLRRNAPYDRIVVPGWLDRHAMREVAYNGYGARTDIVLLPFERRWYDNTLAATRRWERRLERDTVSMLRDIDAGIGPGRELAGRWRTQTDLRLGMLPETTSDDIGDDRPVTDQLEERAVHALTKSIPSASAGQATARAQLVIFDEPGAYALLHPHGRTIVLSSDGGDLEVTSHIDAEQQLFRNVADLEPGMMLALPESSDRDLIDARADLLLPDRTKTRQIADLWKTALKRRLGLRTDELRSFSRKLEQAGEPRSIATLRSWLTDTKSVAPRNYRRVVPLIAELTGDDELSTQVNDVLAAIDLVYRARARAAEDLLQEIFSGELDLDAPYLTFAVDGREVSFALHRIRRCEGIREVPTELIGRAARIVPETYGPETPVA